MSRIEVTSVSRRKGQMLFDAPAAVTVITPEDIERTGHRHLPELLRLVPGMHVGRLTANRWAVAARGFTNEFNSLQLVQMDGRSIYTPFFSGVFWIAQDTMLEDLDRVEVIRGPGATLWGANAVNGIVSYTSKPASETQGVLASGGGGSTEGGFGGVRYGGKVNEDLHYRLYARVQEHLETRSPGFSDDWQRWQTGTRFDWAPKDGPDKVTWQGDVYEVRRAGTSRQAPDIAAGTSAEENGDDRYHGWNFLTRWTHDFGPDNQMQLQAYYDHLDLVITQNEQARGSIARARHNTADLDFQHGFRLGDRQRLVYGVNYRTVEFEIQNGFALTFDPTGRRTHAVSGFMQDTITAIEDTLEFTVGSKLEYNSFTGFEYQPSLKALYKPHRDHAIWTSVARAIRVPALFENDILVFTPVVIAPGLSATITGNRGLESENVASFELGYRTQPFSWFSLDATAFYNRFDNLIGNQPLSPLPPVQELDNVDEAGVLGAELAVHFQPREDLRLTAHYSFLDVDHGPVGAEEESPRHQFHTRAYWDVRKDLELNAALYYVGEANSVNVREYWRADLGVTWRPTRHLELSVWGQNLIQDDHLEFRSPPSLTTTEAQIPRGVYGKLTFRW
ncbi:MAG: TonB-dependent receptor [Planctomycetota bacterium]|nr:TonB-dependent receptor [Planctomycetota bacterium]